MKDLTGQRFSMLTAVQKVGRTKQGNALWECKCDCGKTCIVRSNDLKSGNSKSCGCFKRSLSSARMTKHGMTGTKIHDLWCNIKQRCSCKNNTQFASWGGRGITVCEEWKNNFEAFYEYVSKLPHFGEKGYSLDRINNDGNYAPGNVRWATAKEQANNRRNSKQKGQ